MLARAPNVLRRIVAAYVVATKDLASALESWRLVLKPSSTAPSVVKFVDRGAGLASVRWACHILKASVGLPALGRWLLQHQDKRGSSDFSACNIDKHVWCYLFCNDRAQAPSFFNSLSELGRIDILRHFTAAASNNAVEKAAKTAYRHNRLAAARFLERAMCERTGVLSVYATRVASLADPHTHELSLRCWLVAHGLVCAPKQVIGSATRSASFPAFCDFCDQGQRWHAHKMVRLVWRFRSKPRRDKELLDWVYYALGRGCISVALDLLRRDPTGKMSRKENWYPYSLSGAVAVACERGDFETVKWIFANSTLSVKHFMTLILTSDDEIITYKCSEDRGTPLPLVAFAHKFPHILRWFAERAGPVSPDLMSALAAGLVRDPVALQRLIAQKTGAHFRLE